jgi:general secretion pathway protein K
MSLHRTSERGAALVTVLWLTMALSVIGLAVASTVRNESERAGNLVDGSRAGFLARGAIERLRHFLRYPPLVPVGAPPPPYVPGQQRMYWSFPGGDVLVEMLPETGKLNINQAPPPLLLAALAATGMPAPAIGPFVNAIVDWRTPMAPGFAPASTFWVRHASFEQIEELLLVPGVTSDLYFGYRDRLPGGEIVDRPGLRDLLSVHGAANALDINAAHPALLRAVGVDPALVAQIVALRQITPIPPDVALRMFPAQLPSGLQLRAGTDAAYTVKATARPRRPDGQLSDYRRTVAALMIYESTLPTQPQQVTIRQWHELAVSEIPWPGEAQ